MKSLLTKHLIALGLLAFSFSALVKAADNEDILATRGKVTASTLDLRAYNLALPDGEYEKTLTQQKIRQTLDEILDLKSLGSSDGKPLTRLARVSNEESRAFDLITRRGQLAALQAIAERRATDEFNRDLKGAEVRSLEIYKATDATSARREYSADFQHILIDLRKRPFNDSVRRAQDAMEALRVGKSFDFVVAEYSDEENAKETAGKHMRVQAKAMDGYMAKLLFTDLKPGAFSEPFPSRSGLHIIKLDSVYPPDKLPYESLKPTLMQRLLADAIAVARNQIVAEIRKSPTEFNEENIRKIALVAPSSEAIERAKRSAREANENMSRPAAKSQ
jgi:parvulin-like peptidyl-prolyl isomerase